MSAEVVTFPGTSKRPAPPPAADAPTMSIDETHAARDVLRRARSFHDGIEKGLIGPPDDLELEKRDEVISAMAVMMVRLQRLDRAHGIGGGAA